MDARFNMYILEHGYLWIEGVDRSFWSAPFFYPQPFVTAYSDNLLGSLPFYFLLRKIGEERENAFRAYIILIFILNYLSTYWVLRRWNICSLGAIGGAYLFTFSLPSMAQINHIQLAPRFLIPFGFYFLFLLCESKKIKYFYLLLLTIGFQIYIGIYMGYMLCLCLFVTFLVIKVREIGFWKMISIFQLKFHASRMIENKFRYFLSISFFNKNKNYILGIIVFIIILIPLIIPYLIVSRQVGTRDWAEISSMLPRISSYFHGPSSLVYGKIMKFGEALPLPWEHQLFMGIFPFLSIIFFLIIFHRRLDKRVKFFDIGLTLLISLLIIFIITLYVNGLSIYRLIAIFPGANAIRSVTRIILVMLFPIAFITAVSLDIIFFILKNRMTKIGLKRWKTYAFLTIYSVSMIICLAIDQLSWIPMFSIAEERSRLQKIESKVFSQMKSHDLRKNRNILWVNKSDGSQYGVYLTHLDAMLVGQDLRIPVINGYSGNIPPKYGGSLYQLTQGKCSDMSLWIKNKMDMFNKSKIIQIGTTCPNIP